MALFQHSVIKEYIQELDNNSLNSAFEKFHKHFGNTEIQNNIREAKEEQYQEGFLRELFVNVLGYTLYPQTNYNLITEQKNEKDSKKADGAILQQVADATRIIAVIELKGTNTTDLSKIEVQAFSYKNNQKDCKYVITSNFEKIRFYIDNAIDFEEFNLFNLTKDRFNLLYLCLAKENLLNGIPQKIKDASVSQEENITKKLYSDYSTFKRLLFQNICSLNPEYDKLTLFQKTQKLLDRFLFIFFAEDRLLLPPNSIREIIKQWEQLKELDNYTPLYDRFKKYFGYMNTGFKGKQYEIFAYNGGLFAPNEILDNLKIDDQILFEHTLKLSNYDYDTEVDVNILGHIFEHSLNEIEEIQSELEGKELDKSKTKRKKDGVFYTPKYITKYIVENTVGALCTEKKKELEINDEEIVISKRKDKKKELIEKIDNYRNWLLKLTICDPACGSGAFLNQALDYLLIEHKKLDELKARITNSPMIFSDIENSVLENNIFGVDLNEEAVEIAKLSLWLKTAQKGRKLSILTSNIKCGNSLIDDKNIAGEKAFNWQNEFPNIFDEKGKKVWHITTATHNSRYSQRIFDNQVILGAAEWFDTEDEIIITETIKAIAIADNLNILEYNICGDHMHILLVCEEEELPNIVGKLKSVSAKVRNRKRGYTAERIVTDSTRGHAPLSESESVTVTESDSSSVSVAAPLSVADDTPKRGGTQRQVWTQKFGKSEIKDDTYLANALEYIRNNRKKHELPEIKEIEKLKKEFLCTIDHAFRPEYNGGFDVIIGNPPYVDIKALPNEIVNYFFQAFKTAENRINLYSLFIEKGVELLKNKGILSFINPNSMLVNSSYKKLRLSLINDLKKIIKLPDNVFADAKVETIIFEIQKGFNNDLIKAIIYSKDETINYIDDNLSTDFSKSVWKNQDDVSFNIYSTNIENSILQKIEKDSVSLESLADFSLGITPYDKYKGHTEEIIKNRAFHSLQKLDESYKPLITGENITRYFTIPKIEEFIRYGEWLGATREERFFIQPRILIRQIVSGKPPRIYASYTDESYYFTQIGFGILSKNINAINPKYLLAILNSTLLNFYHSFKYLDLEKNLFQKILIANCRRFPIKNISEKEQQKFINKVDILISKNQALYETRLKFVKMLTLKFDGFKTSKKIESFETLNSKDFLKEFEKQKIKLNISEQSEWIEFFEKEKSKTFALQNGISKTDKEIDQMVYELYELTEEEIKIVENL